jgi:retron-type reverse transcriptase
MITLKKCQKAYPLHNAALAIANKVAFDKGKGFARSWDNQSYWEYASNLDTKLPKLEKGLKEYQFQPTAKKVKQIKWKKRVLYISTWEDKIVETWLSRSLNKLLSKWFSKRSYAYRIERIGVDTCQRDVVAAIKNCKYIARRDITNFFYTIDHQILLDKLKEIIDPHDHLFELLRQRIEFSYEENQDIHKATIGLPFGSPIACMLANIYLTELDHKLVAQEAHYFRYADDFLIASPTVEPVLNSSKILKDHLDKLKLELHPDKADNLSFCNHESFDKVNRFKYLGLEYWEDGIVRLPIEKKRKIIGIFRRTLNNEKKKLQKIEDLDQRLKAAISCVHQATLKRIRYAAIIDYYLKHIEDEQQLKIMDREIAEMVISTVLNKPFRPKDFKTIPYGKLRDMGLLSLVHRNRLHRHGHLNVPFLSMYNSILFERYQEGRIRRANRINQIQLSRKLKKIQESNN